MFTGIIEEIGVVRHVFGGPKSARLSINAKTVLRDLAIGDSVATNGVCLTVTSLGKDQFTADVMNVTLQRSSLGELRSGSAVNLERAMAADGRFGGHLVTGHIDGIGRIMEIRRDDIAIWYTIKAPDPIMEHILEKGSIAIDGISLTVAKLGRESFSVSIIPHTAKETTLSRKRVGESVNLENDIMGKYVHQRIDQNQGQEQETRKCKGRGITRAFLLENGF